MRHPIAARPPSSIAPVKVSFLLPGTTPAYHCGGLFYALNLARLMGERCETEVVTYENREQEYAFLGDIDVESLDDPPFWLVTWGPHVSRLLARLGGQRVVYYAQSPGWGIELPASVPIFCVSRYMVTYWTERAPHNPVFLFPPALDPAAANRGLPRDIDVLYLSRKTTPYVDGVLAPALRDRFDVHTVAEPVPHGELLELFNRAKVYLYDSKEASDGPAVDNVEGFGLQALEALVCGCTVASNVDGGLSDFLDPGVNCLQLGVSLEHDVQGITGAVTSYGPSDSGETEQLASRFSEDALRERVRRVVPALEAWCDTVPVDGQDDLTGLPAYESWRGIAMQQEHELATLRHEVEALRQAGRSSDSEPSHAYAASVEAELQAVQAELEQIRSARYWRVLSKYWALRRKVGQALRARKA
jgi:hypothetical protein